jgi:transposase-like protein
MEKLSQQKQTKEPCEPAVRLVYEQELTTPEAARGLSMSGQTTDLDAEVSRLKRELMEVRMECDILKRTVAYFAKAKRPGGGS